MANSSPQIGLSRRKAPDIQSPVCPRDSQKRHPFCAGAFQRLSASGSSRTRRHYVIDQKDAPSLYCVWRAALKGLGDVPPPRGVA
jgi:hypothetical protein